MGLREDAGAFFICQGVILLVGNIAQSLGFLVSVGTELPYAPSRPTTAHHAKTPKACPNRVRVCAVCAVCVCVCVCARAATGWR